MKIAFGFYFIAVWIVVMIYLLQKTRRARTLAATHPADHSPAVRDAYRRQTDAGANLMVIFFALVVVSAIALWIGKIRSSDTLFVAGGTGIIVFLGLAFAATGFSHRCPVCGSQVATGARFCTRCGAQLQP